MASLQAESSTLVISGLPPTMRLGTSSSLTSPMDSPRINAMESSLPDVTATSLELHRTNTHSPVRQFRQSSGEMSSQDDAYECFNDHSSPIGHYYSALSLYARGIWVGYL